MSSVVESKSPCLKTWSLCHKEPFPSSALSVPWSFAAPTSTFDRLLQTRSLYHFAMIPTTSMSKEEDPFDALLSLEGQYHKEGFDVGLEDGKRAGLIEGRLFGLENGFEKYVAMGRLHGRATVWAGRVRGSDSGTEQTEAGNIHEEKNISLARLHNPRLEAHVQTLYALTEPGSLATENSGDAVANFDDRLKRAEGKFKVIEKLTGGADQDYAGRVNGDLKAKRDGEIEDTSVLNVRH